MIIVEGPDGSGKTTLARQLGYQTRRYRALRSGEGATLQDGSCGKAVGWGGGQPAHLAYAREILAAVEVEGQPLDVTSFGDDTAQTGHPRLAFDRFHVSERVYGPMLRGSSGIGKNHRILLERVLAARAVPTIICLPKFSTTLANVTHDGRERPAFQTADFLLRAYERWSAVAESLVERFGDWVHIYNYEGETAYGDLVHWLGDRPLAAHRWINGSPKARFLFVGEQAKGPLDLAFYDDAGSSGYLHRALDLACYQEHEIAFTNGLNLDGTTRDLVRAMVSLPQMTEVVCLGTIAREAVGYPNIKGVRVNHLDHPQYRKRFKAHLLHEYVDQLNAIRAS